MPKRNPHKPRASISLHGIDENIVGRTRRGSMDIDDGIEEIVAEDAFGGRVSRNEFNRVDSAAMSHSHGGGYPQSRIGSAMSRGIPEGRVGSAVSMTRSLSRPRIINDLDDGFDSRPKTPDSSFGGAIGRPQTAIAKQRSGSAWKRRHLAHAARKNSDWADLFMSSAATEVSIAAFVSFKTGSKTAADAEYFFNIIPKAVAKEDELYKEILAVYNAFKFWSRTLAEKRLVISTANPKLAKLLKSGKVKTSIGRNKIIMLHEIYDLCVKLRIQLRVLDIDHPENGIAYWLCRSQIPACQQQFEDMLEDEMEAKRGQFIAAEKFFPPMYA